MNLFDNYQIIEQVYLDNHYTIYRAIHLSDRTTVVIKTINPQVANPKAKLWLKNEYKILCQVNIEGIVNSSELEKEQKNLVLISENFTGEYFNYFLDTIQVTTKDFFKIAIQLVEIIQKLHQNQIIHHNLNPSSIVINPETFEVKITNFSLATNFDRENQTSPIDLEISDITYISPEQTGRMNHGIDYRTDFYSLGIIFYRMLTGKTPYKTQDLFQLMHYHLAKTPVAPHQISSQIEQTVSEIVMKLLAKNPKDRYQSTCGILNDLKACQIQYRDRGKIAWFEIGKSDLHSDFIVSHKLYGRTFAINTLTSALERVYSGATELVLVSGQAGIGKTSLIREVTRSLIEPKTFLLIGQFEKLTVNIPYIGIKQAFGGLIQQILTQDSDRIKVWREKLLDVLGSQGKVITDILPELELIIGSQPKIPKLSAKETENRFNIKFVEFIKFFSTQEHPLVLLLDDLQWADSASLNLLSHLLDLCQDRYLLIVWSYRDDEIKPLASASVKAKESVFSDFINFPRLIAHTVEKIEQTVAVSKIVLEPLSLHAIERLLVDTLHCQDAEALSFAELLWERTGGNPFFIHQLLPALYEEGLFTFNFDRFSWQWNLEAIRSTPIHNYSVLELVAQKLDRLSSEVRETLQIAACIGNQFDLETLAIASYQEREKIVKILASALQVGIIVPASDSTDSVYQFLHNHLYQLVYASLADVEKAKIHLKIGQFWFSASTTTSLEENIFHLVSHLNLGRKLVEGIFKIRIAELNLIAGKRAKNTIAYEVAANYLDIALDLLSPATWHDNYDLMFDVHLEAVEIHYLQTNFERAKNLANLLLSRSKTVLEQVKVYKIKIRAYIACNQMQSAIDTGLYVLNLLKVSLTDLLTQNEGFSAWLTEENNLLSSLQNLPPMSDPNIIAAMEILGAIVPAIYIIKPQLFPTVVFTMIELCLQYGNSQFSAFAYGLYGLLLCAKGDIDTGYQLGQLSLTIQEQLNAKKLKSRVDFIFNNTIRHWKEPAIYTIGYFLEGIQAAIEIGNIEDACFHAKYYCTYLFFVGELLPTVDRKSLVQINLIQNFKQDFQLNYARLWRQLNLNLQGLAEERLLLIGESFDEAVMLPLWQKDHNATSLFAFYLTKLILCYLLKDYPQAVINAQKGKQYLQAAIGTMCFSMYHFYAALAMLAVCYHQTDLQAEFFLQIVAYQEQLKIWANYSPDNYLNKYQLVTAEVARVLGKKELAAENYDLAITSATQAGYLHETALAEELTAEFYLAQDRTKIAQYYLNDAYKKYLRWGALAKIRALESQYSHLLTKINKPKSTANHFRKEKRDSDRENLAKLDLLSVIKASQAIASEIILDNLLSKMMEIVMENAGARKAILLLQQNSSWIVAASATIMTEVQVTLSNIPIAKYSDLPHSIINYVQSTCQTVMLEVASNENLFTKDAYIIENQPQSVLAYPIIYKNELQGIIYLENNLVRGVFTSQKLEVLKVLLSQVSISIENARLYKDLEDHASVQKSLKQKEILLKEIHHRVKNNLLVVSSLLEFQTIYVDDPKIIKLLENCQNRITSMALVHQHLYGSDELNTVNFAEYIKSLLDNLAHAQACEERNINFICDLQEIELNIETANPCGLIINELVSNAIEHGFLNCDRGNIWVSLQQDRTQEIVLIIKDDGIGFGESLDFFNSNSLGLKLVNSLVKQLEATIKLDRTNGTTIEVAFEQLDYARRI
jgi:histidine kinase